MMEKSRSAKFFCENCGSEVARNAKFCRHCGRFFSSVRCPQCGKTGTPEEFSKGCPKCGYTIDNSHKDEKRLTKKEKTAPFFSRYALKRQINHWNSKNGSKKQISGDESLPLWIFILIFFGLVALIYFFRRFF